MAGFKGTIVGPTSQAATECAFSGRGKARLATVLATRTAAITGKGGACQGSLYLPRDFECSTST